MRLQVIENTKDSPREYCCPGESGAISQAVHESRMANGWHGCQACLWNPDVAGFKMDGLLLQDQCISGPYLNALNRRTSQLLTAVICDSLAEIVAETPRFVIGFDQVFGGPDIATGAVQAACRSSCDVLDVGYATFASMEFARQHAQADAAILIHEGPQNGHIGFAFWGSSDSALQPEWDRFGIECRTQTDDLNRATHLILPQNQPNFRNGRDSGNVATLEIEGPYLAKLRRFWPQNSQIDCDVFVQNPLTARYLQHVLSEKRIVLNDDARLVIDVDVDDRHFTVQDNGTPMSPEQMTEAINQSSDVPQHLTAHLTSADQQVVLIDAAHHSASQHEVVCDAIAVLGVLLIAHQNHHRQI